MNEIWLCMKYYFLVRMVDLLTATGFSQLPYLDPNISSDDSQNLTFINSIDLKRFETKDGRLNYCLTDF